MSKKECKSLDEANKNKNASIQNIEKHSEKTELDDEFWAILMDGMDKYEDALIELSKR